MRRLVPLLAVLSLVLAACGGAVAGGASTGQPASGSPVASDPGDVLPAATLPVLGGDGSLATAELTGQPAIVNFWATWCVFCVEEMPDLEQVHLALADEVRFVGVDREDPDEDRAVALAEETGVTYELVQDTDGSFFRAVRARGMPTTLLVDADGVIRFRHAGPLTADQLLALVEEHLGIRG